MYKMFLCEYSAMQFIIDHNGLAFTLRILSFSEIGFAIVASNSNSPLNYNTKKENYQNKKCLR